MEADRQEGTQPGLSRFGGFSSNGGSILGTCGLGGWLLWVRARGSRQDGLVRRAGKPPEQPAEGGFDEKVQRPHQVVGHPFRARDNPLGEEGVGDGLRRAVDVSFIFHDHEPIGL
jgi:hypothetical protein